MDNIEKQEISESARHEEALRKKYKIRKRNKRIKQSIILVMIVIAIMIAKVYYDKAKIAIEEQMSAFETEMVEKIYTVEKNTYESKIDVSGFLTANDIQNVRFRSTGVVTDLFIEEGDFVKKGELLAKLDSTTEDNNLKQILDNIKKASIYGSVAEVENYEMQKTNAEKALEYKQTFANFDATVASVSIDVDDYFEAGSTVATLVDVSSLKAIVEIDEIDMKNVKLGQIVNLTSDALPGVHFDATVSYIPMLAKYTDKGIGVVEVELEIKNPPAGLRPGYSFNGIMKVSDLAETILIKQDAISVGLGGVSTVIKKTGDTTETITVELNYLGEGYYSLVSGDIKEGDELVYEITAAEDASLQMKKPTRKTAAVTIQ